jgi:hypothetical protein
MKSSLLLLLLLLVPILFCACGTTQVRYDSVKRSPTKSVDVYRNAQTPSRAYKVIGMLADDGRMEEKDYLEGKFTRKARRMGGNGLLFVPFEQTSKAPEGWEIYDTYAYKAYVVTYDAPAMTAAKP